MARYNLRDDFPLGTARGNTCYLCGSVDSENDQEGKMTRVIDTNVHIDLEGWLMICEACVVDMAKLLGMMTTRQASMLRNKAEKLDAELSTTKALLSIADDAVNSITRYKELTEKKS